MILPLGHVNGYPVNPPVSRTHESSPEKATAARVFDCHLQALTAGCRGDGKRVDAVDVEWSNRGQGNVIPGKAQAELLAIETRAEVSGIRTSIVCRPGESGTFEGTSPGRFE